MANILEALNYSGGSATSNWDRLQFILKRNADTFDASLHAALTWDQESIFNWDSVKWLHSTTVQQMEDVRNVLW